MSDGTFTLEKLRAAVLLIGRLPPDPLAGANRLLCHENMRDHARQLAAAYRDCGIGSRFIYVEVRKDIPPGHIIAMCRDSVVKIIAPERPALGDLTADKEMKG